MMLDSCEYPGRACSTLSSSEDAACHHHFRGKVRGALSLSDIPYFPSGQTDCQIFPVLASLYISAGERYMRSKRGIWEIRSEVICCWCLFTIYLATMSTDCANCDCADKTHCPYVVFFYFLTFFSSQFLSISLLLLSNFTLFVTGSNLATTKLVPCLDCFVAQQEGLPDWRYCGDQLWDGVLLSL